MKLQELFCSDRDDFFEGAISEWENIEEAQKKYVMYLLGLGKKYTNPNNSHLLYALGITDRIPNGSVTTVSKGGGAPDLDIDICRERRHEVVEYVRRKYGRDRVAHIITFGTMGPKASVRDTARAQQLENYVLVSDKIAKSISVKDKTIDDAIERSDFLKKQEQEYPELFRMAKAISGKTRQTGIHPAGMLITPEPVTNYMPLYYGSKNKDGSTTITQWDMYDVEETGFLKMDFLGLNTLTIIDKTIKRINATYGLNMTAEDIPLDDPTTLHWFSEGLTMGIFQLERKYVQDFCRTMGISTFEDVVVMNAIIRPGTMDAGTTSEFIDRRRGEKEVEYMHPSLEEVLKETYGILCIEENNRITMADGSEKKIRDIKKGDSVVSVDDDLHTMVDICDGCGPTRSEEGVVFRFSNGHELFVTKDHPVLTPNGFKEADYLNENDLVAYAKTALSYNTSSALSKVFDTSIFGEDVSVAYLFGMLVGDGSVSSSVSLCCGSDIRNVETIENWINENIKNIKTNRYFHTRCYYLGLSSDVLTDAPGYGNRKTEFHRFLEENNMKNSCKNKVVPKAIMTGTDEVKLAFIAGLIDSDGFLHEDGTNITSTSSGLLFDVARILRGFGVDYTLDPVRIRYYDSIFDFMMSKYLVLKAIPSERSIFLGDRMGLCPTSLIREHIKDSGMSIRQFCKRTELENQRQILNNDACYYSSARKFGVDLNHCRYTKIVSKQYRHGNFYGMSVRNNHNMICNSIVISNCYQEQAMQTAQAFAGFSLAEADNLRKAIGKKLPEKMAQMKKLFFEKAQSNKGRTLEECEDVFSYLETFARYGFNKSHAASYGKITFQAEWLKAHYTTEFMCELLNGEYGSSQDSKVGAYIEEARFLGIEIIPPSVLTSEAFFEVRGDKKIEFGLAFVKNVSPTAVDEILRVRGRFNNMAEFLLETQFSVLKSKAVNSLINAGAFDCFGDCRDEIIEKHMDLRVYITKYKQQQKRKEDGVNLRSEITIDDIMLKAEEPVDPFERRDLEKMLDIEYQETDAYLTESPMLPFMKEIRTYTTTDIADLLDGFKRGDGHEVIIGLVSEMREHIIKGGKMQGQEMAFITATKDQRSIDCIAFPSVYAKLREIISIGKVYLFFGYMRTGSFILSDMKLLSKV